jgi:hypothetical protein
MKMMDEGKSLKEMRAQIEKTFSKYGPPTPTGPSPSKRKSLTLGTSRPALDNRTNFVCVRPSDFTSQHCAKLLAKRLQLTDLVFDFSYMISC